MTEIIHNKTDDMLKVESYLKNLLTELDSKFKSDLAEIRKSPISTHARQIDKLRRDYLRNMKVIMDKLVELESLATMSIIINDES